MSGDTTNYSDPMDDPVTASLLRVLASRVAAAYAVLDRQDESDRWTRVAFAAALPPRQTVDV